jgi:hypothetical protein
MNRWKDNIKNDLMEALNFINLVQNSIKGELL